MNGSGLWLEATGSNRQQSAIDGSVITVRDISPRKQRERELDRRREQLALLHELNDVVRGISGTVMGQSTREEIEAMVSDRVAASESYQFAWICGVETSLHLVRRR